MNSSVPRQANESIVNNTQSADETLEVFGRICEHFLQPNNGRPKHDPRPGTYVYSWAIDAVGGRIGPGILLSHLVYLNRRTNDDTRQRLRACQQPGLRDLDLNEKGDEYLRRPWITSYREVYECLGLSQDQFIDAADFLERKGFVIKDKVAKHRGRVLVLSADYHDNLFEQGCFDKDYQTHPDEGTWRTWLNASEVIAMPSLTQAMVLARWLRVIESGVKKKRRYDNTHAQLADHLGLWTSREPSVFPDDVRAADRAVGNALRKLYRAGVLKRDYVTKQVGGPRKDRIPSPTHGKAEREQLAKLTVEALARHYDVPDRLNLNVFWQEDIKVVEMKPKPKQSSNIAID